jgi:hypothetical protein
MVWLSGSDQWGWSLNDPAPCNSHPGCPAILPQLSDDLYEIIFFDRRRCWSVVCGTKYIRLV